MGPANDVLAITMKRDHVRARTRFTPPQAFISYSWDDEDHKAWVKQLAIRLRGDGVDVTLDRWHAAPGDQIPAFMERAVRKSDVVIAVCTPRFQERSDERVGGVGYEGDIMTALALTYGNNKKFIPVLRGESWERSAPLWLLGRAKVDLRGDPYAESQYDELLRTLHGAREVAPPVGHRPDFNGGRGAQGVGVPIPPWPEIPAPVSWPMADHSHVREAFVGLLDRKASHRFLPICGPAETGKSHITKQMLANGLPMAGLSCGRCDFKGTADLGDEIQAFAEHLGLPPVPANLPVKEGLVHILQGLKRRASATLLVFDTYETAGDARDWVEKRLLPGLIQAPWLRVVIAGQSVPEHAGAVWASVSRHPIRLVPPPPEDWFKYGKLHRPGLTLELVKDICALADNKASVLAKLFGPVM